MRAATSVVVVGLLVSGCRLVAGYEAAATDAAVDQHATADGPRDGQTLPPDAGGPEAAPPCLPWSNSGICPEPRQLALGIDFSCLLVASGAVYCWGDNAGGVLGVEGPDVATPQLVQGVDLEPGHRGAQRRQLVAGGAHVCGIERNGQTICWGYNGDGQVAPAAKLGWLGPTPVGLPSGQAADSLAAGHLHSCALASDGKVFCWGDSDSGKLGVAGALGVAQVALSGKAKALGCGFDHCCVALDDDVSVACWGDNSRVQLGDSASGVSSATPVVTKPGISPIERISCGGRSCCVQGGAGGEEVRCWGDNRAGQLGTGQSGPPQGATAPVLGAPSPAVSAVRLGGAHACVRRQDGSASCWGYSVFGQTLAPPEADYGEPQPLPQKGYEELALGLFHSCAIRDGGVECWGRNRAGALGDGQMHRRSTPQPIAGTWTIKPTLLALGDHNSCAANKEGQLYCWGRNDFAQSAPKRSWAVPTPTLLASSTRVEKLLALGGAHGCAQDKGSGKPVCWGGSWAGQTTLSGKVSTPPLVLTTPTSLDAIAVGGEHSCAISSGEVYCWGNNRLGQLGVPKADFDYTTPQKIAALGAGNKAIVVRTDATCVINSDDELRCWGDDEHQQIGTPNATGFSAPLQSTKVAQVTLGERHGCALRKSDGTVLCWGDDSHGRLGVEQASGTQPYEQVSGLGKTEALAAGGGFTCALDDKDVVRCWGHNQHGELGTQQLRASFKPLQVALPTTAAMIAAGIGHVCALLANETISCWGDTSLGALGDGTAPSRVPRVILRKNGSASSSPAP